ncbi:MAG: hypothetical protein M1270_05470, partial [Gammaproteobacteria bacterium]|nr:hypothetical protein [Gammaproteobacteria bacterium]
MSLTDPVFQWLAYELAAIFAVLFIWVLIRARRKHKRTQAAAAKTAKFIKNSYEQRVASLSEQLSSRYGLSGAALDSMVEELMLREKEIFKSIVNLYSAQDEKTLNNFPEQITSLTDATLSIMQADIEQDAEVSELRDVVDETLLAEEPELEIELAEPLAETEEDPQAELDALAEFDGVFDDGNADTVVAQTEMLDDETEVIEELNDSAADFDIELTSAETDEVDVDDIFNQNTPVEEPVLSEQEALIDDAIAAEPELDIDPDLLAEFDGLTEDEPLAEPELEPEPEPAKSAMRMADFLKNDWNPTIPDVYGKTPLTETAPATEIENESENADSSTELKSMKAYLNTAWTNQVPDIYGKSAAEPVVDQIDEDFEAFEHQELKLHAFETDDTTDQALSSPVQPIDIELDALPPTDIDSEVEEMISVAEIDDLMRGADVPSEDEQAGTVNEHTALENDFDFNEINALVDEETAPEEDNLAESTISNDVIEPVKLADTNEDDSFPPELTESNLSDDTSEIVEQYLEADLPEPTPSYEQSIEEKTESDNTSSTAETALDISEQNQQSDIDAVEPQPIDDSTELTAEADPLVIVDEETTDWQTDLIAEDNDFEIAETENAAILDEPVLAAEEPDFVATNDVAEELDLTEIAELDKPEEPTLTSEEIVESAEQQPLLEQNFEDASAEAIDFLETVESSSSDVVEETSDSIEDDVTAIDHFDELNSLEETITKPETSTVIEESLNPEELDSTAMNNIAEDLDLSEQLELDQQADAVFASDKSEESVEQESALEQNFQDASAEEIDFLETPPMLTEEVIEVFNEGAEDDISELDEIISPENNIAEAEAE